MRHRNSSKRKLSRTPAHRHAMFANLANSLLEHEQITTTEAKAKDLRGFTEKLISLGKRAALVQGDAGKARATALRRQAFAELRSAASVELIFGSLASRFRDRKGGYTRVYKLGNRPGDNAPMAVIELVDRAEKAAPAAE